MSNRTHLIVSIAVAAVAGSAPPSCQGQLHVVVIAADAVAVAGLVAVWLVQVFGLVRLPFVVG